MGDATAAESGVDIVQNRHSIAGESTAEAFNE